MDLESLDTDSELAPVQARRLLSLILREGEVLFSRHATDELEADGLTEQDALRVLSVGRIVTAWRKS